GSSIYVRPRNSLLPQQLRQIPFTYRGAAPGAPRRETGRVASLPAREPLRGSRWLDSRRRRSSRFAPLSFRD
ncbi:hypothetical protein R4317_32060, partial [Rhodococcus oxybenzonivorans]|uniref:hypothetical protein n=1 Tax=Rhodococcus oxybenzonivorans TaxID=1990687 RepID=UPI002953A130